MDETYDVVVLGTGIKECILSGLLSVHKLKVLNIDQNNYYGGESASLNLEDLFAKFAPPGTAIPPELGRARDWNVDLCPKFLMGCGNLVKMLIHTDVTRYLEFVSVAGSYVMQDGKVHKVPATPGEALSSGLLGFFEKNRFRKFLNWVNGYEQDKASTHDGNDAQKKTCKEVFDYFSLSDSTANFTGHAIALYSNDAQYLNLPASELVVKAQMYANSVARYGNSPFLYPRYGIGGIPEGFARLCAINGGTQMLGKKIDGFEYDTDGKVCGVKLDNTVVKTKAVLADPSFLLNTPKIAKAERVCRSICFLKHPVPNTSDMDSLQIIVPAAQTGRKNDIYVAVVSAQQNVCAQGYYIACVSSVLEGADERASDKELQPAFALLGHIAYKFTWVSQRYVPTDNGSADNIFVTSSLSASSHFEPETEEVLEMFPRVSGGQVIDLSIKPELAQE